MICQWVLGCKEEVVAKIGLPGPNSVWVCKKHFNEWERRKENVSGTGRIVDFTKPVPPEDRPTQPPEIQRLSSQDAQPQGVEVIVHENVIVESDKIRSTVRRPGDPEIQVREGVTQAEWERIKRGTRMLSFLCGCTSKMEPPIDREIFNTFDSVVEDWQGHLVCLVHKERLRGWRSVPYTALTMPPGIECSSWTPLEFERWKIWGEFPRMRPLTLNTNRVESKLDNRDPEQVGREYLAAMAVARNGNVVTDQHGQTALDNLRGDWPR